MKSKLECPFDFTLYINEKIICKRCFFIRNYDEKTVVDLYYSKDMILDIVDLIKNHLKSKTINLLWKNYNPHNQNQISDKRLNRPMKEDLFKITISQNSNLMISSCLDGNLYPPKIRYDVDIRSIIPSIISVIKLHLEKID